MTDVAQRQKVYRMLAANPDIRHILARALEVEEEGSANSPYYLGWRWDEIPVQTQKLRVLVEEGLVKVNYKSQSSTEYLVRDPELVREALKAIGDEEEPPEEGQTPADLFDSIVGHEEVKYWVHKSLTSPRPVHILLVGPPATAKSMFLEALGSLPGSQYALGGSSSRAGIADFLVNFRPRYLVLDEIDKMNREDFSVLLSLMQSGVVARLKKGMRETDHMTTWVFAGCNKRGRLPPELLSRFVDFDFILYTREEFVEVAVSVITKQLGKDENLARYIAERVSRRTRDVRQAIHVGELCDTREEVDRFESGADPGRIF